MGAEWRKYDIRTLLKEARKDEEDSRSSSPLASQEEISKLFQATRSAPPPAEDRSAAKESSP